MRRKLARKVRRKKETGVFRPAPSVRRRYGRRAKELFRSRGPGQNAVNQSQIATLSAALVFLLQCSESQNLGKTTETLSAALQACSTGDASRLRGSGLETGNDCFRRLNEVRRSLKGDAKKHAEALATWLSGRVKTPGAASRSGDATAEIEQAIKDLEEVVRDSGGNPDPANDLAAIYFSAAQRFERPTHLLRAVEVLAPHLRQANPPDEILWNAALIFEALALPEESRDAWRRYLAQDSSSPWAEEAREHLRPLEALPAPGKLRRHFPFVRTSVALPSSDAGARERLESFRLQLLEAWPRDPLNEQAAKLAKEVLDRGDKVEIAHFSDLHEHLERGYLEYQLGNADKAAALLVATEQGLAAAKNPLSLWAIYCLALVDNSDDRLTDGQNRIDLLISRLDGKRYQELFDLANWQRGLLRYRLGRPLEALAPYQLSRTGFIGREDAENAATIDVLLGETLLSLGRDEEAWNHLLADSRLQFTVRDSRRALIRALTRANAARGAGFGEAAALYYQQSLGQAKASENIGHIAIAATGAIRHQLEMGNRREAAATFENTMASIETLPDSLGRARSLADLAPLKVELEVASLASRLEILGRAIEFYRQGKIDTPEINAAFESRARLNLASGDPIRAALDLEESLNFYEQRLANSGEVAQPSSAGRPAVATYRHAIALRLELGQPEAAYRLAVRARSYTLSSSDTPRAWADRHEDLAELAQGQALVHFLLLEDRVAIFVRSREGLDVLESPLAPPDLRRLAAEFRSLLQARVFDEEAALGVARRLYLALLAPVDRSLGSKKDLLLVAEDELATLPFSALVDPATGRYAIEDRLLLNIPSEGVYQRALPRAREWRLEGKKLALADPAFDEALWPSLKRLPGAMKEGRAAEDVFPHLNFYFGVGASAEVLRREATDAGLLLIASHSVTSSRSAGRSVLLLAKTPDHLGSFYQKDIYELDLRANPLVVLSACGSGRTTGEEAPPSSIANGFLAAGASMVIAPLFDVDDEKTTELMTALYNELAAGRPPVEAFRQAQLSYLADSRAKGKDPWLWSFFGAFGASR